MYKFLLLLLFYSIMVYIYRVADGKIKRLSKSEDYEKWLLKYGSKLKRWVIISSIVFTILFILSL